MATDGPAASAPEAPANPPGPAGAPPPAAAAAAAAAAADADQDSQAARQQGGGGGGGGGEDTPEAPASPPLPARHTAATPGPRASRFQEMYGLALSHTLARVSEENLAACYPTVAARAPGMLRQVQRQMVDRLRFLCDREFDKILQERGVVPKLNELESLVGDAARRKGETAGDKPAPVPPHLLPADAVLAAHLAPHLAAQQSQLNARLQTVQAHNVRLFADITAQRAEAERLLAAAERACADVGAAAALLGGEAGVEALAREARDAELEMSGA